MSKIFANPTVRLAARALVAAAIAAATSYKSSGGVIVWHTLAVGAGLAFCEFFTPLNAAVGFLKTASEQPAAPVAPPAPVVPPAPPAP